MGLDTRLKRAKSKSQGSDTENQSRVSKITDSLTRRSNYLTPKRRTVLSDLSNQSSLVTPSKEIIAEPKELNEKKQCEMKKAVQTVSTRTSARISASNANKANLENTVSENNIKKPKITKNLTNKTSANSKVETVKTPSTATEVVRKTRANKQSNTCVQTEQQENDRGVNSENKQETNLKSPPPKTKKKTQKITEQVEEDSIERNERKSSLRPRKSLLASSVVDKVESLCLESHKSNQASPEPLAIPVGTKSLTTVEDAASSSNALNIPAAPLSLAGEATTKRPYHSRRKNSQDAQDKPSHSKSPINKRPMRQARLKNNNKTLSLDKNSTSELETQNGSKQSQTKVENQAQTKTSVSVLSFYSKTSSVGAQNKSSLASPQLTSPKSSKMSSQKGDALAEKSTEKKLPVWKQETKSATENITSAADDIYDFEYDPKDIKPKKTRQKRLKKVERVKRTKKPRIEPENLPPIELKLPDEFVEKTLKRPTSLDNNELNQSIVVPSTNRLPASTPINPNTFLGCDDHFDQPSVLTESLIDHQPPFNPVDATDHLQSERVATPSEELIQPNDPPDGIIATSEPSSVPLSLENCFGFDGPEEVLPPVRVALMKSTPVKRPEPGTAAHFRPSVSPVRKMVSLNRKKSTGSRPARLDKELARDIIGVHPFISAKEKQKQTTLVEYIKEVETMNKSIEEEKIHVPPTPPTVFSAPARRSYSKHDVQKVKRTMFKDHLDPEDDDRQNTEELDENEENSSPNAGTKKPKKSYNTKGKQKKSKQEKEVDEWAQMMAAHFDDIDKSDLIC